MSQNERRRDEKLLVCVGDRSTNLLSVPPDTFLQDYIEQERDLLFDQKRW